MFRVTSKQPAHPVLPSPPRPETVRVVEYNVNSWGAYALSDARPTALYFRDRARHPQIVQKLTEVRADIIVLIEAWDDAAWADVPALQAQYPHIYPQSLPPPSLYGIDAMKERVRKAAPFLGPLALRHTGAVVSAIVHNHYPAEMGLLHGALEAVDIEDRVMRYLRRTLHLGHILGHGIRVFSRFPIEDVKESELASKVDLDQWTDKRQILLKFRKPDGTVFHMLVGHHTEGISKKAHLARADQQAQAVGILGSVEGAALFVGDVNVVAEDLFFPDGSMRSGHEGEANGCRTEEYLQMLKRFRSIHLEDACRAVCPNARRDPKITFHNKNPYSERRGSVHAPGEKPCRIDYVWCRGLKPIELRVLRNHFVSRRTRREGPYPLSDHFAVFCELALP